jgi:hypothetical protein
LDNRVFSVVLFLFVTTVLVGEKHVSCPASSAVSVDIGPVSPCMKVEERLCRPSPGEDWLLFVSNAFSVVLLLLTVGGTGAPGSISSSGSADTSLGGSGVAARRL